MDTSFCSCHKQPAVLFDANKVDSNLRGLCSICVQQSLNNSQQNEDNDIERQKTVDQLKSQTKKIIQVLNTQIDNLNSYKKQINEVLDLMISKLLQQLEIIKQLNYQQSLNLSVDECQKMIFQKNQELQKSVIQQLQNLQQAIQIDKFKVSFYQLAQVNKNLLPKSQQISKQAGNDSFEYQLQDKGGKNQIEYCYAIAFNQDASLIFYGCKDLIKINKFGDSCILDQIQVLGDHSHNVTCLNYLKYSNQLASASEDCSVIIWSENEKGLWSKKQILKEHSMQINCLILNQNEDLLISGGDDKTIGFWKNKRWGWKSQQKIYLNFKVCGLSLDNQQNNLIACSYEVFEILVLSKQNSEWKTTQHIKVQHFGLRLAFLNQNIFAFQPEKIGHLEIYEYDSNLNQFQKTKQIKVKGSEGGNRFYPCQFIDSKQVFFSKNNRYLNVIKRQQNGEFITQQSIDMGTPQYFGRVTEDGLNLVIWDYETRKIQIRKLKYLT